MNRVEAAIEAAEARKVTLFGEAGGPEVNYSTEEQSRAIFSGFDIDYDELQPIANRAGRFFASMAMEIPLTHSHEAAWTEGLLIGLLFLSLPYDPDVSDTDIADSEGDSELH